MKSPQNLIPKRVVLYDVQRLFSRQHLGTPTGIDRVDAAYLSYFLNDPASFVVGVRLNKYGLRLWGARTLKRLIKRNENRREASTKSFRRSPSVRLNSQRWPFAALTPWHLGHIRSLNGKLPTYYVNCGHQGMQHRLEMPHLLSNARHIYYVHDMIPLDFPHLVGLGQPERHVERMTVVAENAAMVISNSHYSAERFTAFAQGQGIETPAPVVLSIGVEPSFLNALSEAKRPAPSDRPYFVIVGTVEPRKNHKLLLEAWKQMIAAGGEVPQLRIIGRRGWTTEENADYDAVVATMAPHVIETGPVSDAELLSQLLGARALLFPSFTEGWGMPAVEAIVAGVPVVISDSPGLVEATQGLAPSLSPHDPTAWAEIVARLADSADPLHGELTAKLAQFKQPTWDDQFTEMEAALTRAFG